MFEQLVASIEKDLQAGGPGSGRHKLLAINDLTDTKKQISKWPKSNAKGYAEQALVEHKNKLTGAYDGKKLVGILGIQHFNEDKTTIVNHLATHPKYEKQGIGSLLLDHAQKEATKNKSTKLQLYTDDKNNNKFYEHKGYKDKGSGFFRKEIHAAGTQGKWPLQGKTTYQGLKIAIENKKGSVRSGKESNGKPWSIKMPFDYGYVIGTEGTDGDEVDVFVGPDKAAKFVYIVHQNKIGADQYDGGESAYDEDKCMLGFPTANAAKTAYSSAYNNVDLFHSMTMLPISEFKEKVFSSKGKIHAAAQLYAGGPGSGPHKIFYHGTNSENISSLNTHGLVPNFRRGGDEYLKQYDTKYYSKLANRSASVFISTDKKEAETYARYSAKMALGTKPVVTTWKVPGSVAKKIIPDEEGSNSSFRFEGRLKPEWFKGLKTLQAGGVGSGRRPEFGLSREEQLAEQRRIANMKRAENRKHGISNHGKPLGISDKSKAALKNIKAPKKDTQDFSEHQEARVEKAIGKGAHRFNQDSEPYDVVHQTPDGKSHGIEVKTASFGEGGRIFQKKSAIDKKNAYAKANKFSSQHTVLVDARSDRENPDIYHAHGHGSFSIHKMEKVPGGLGGLRSFMMKKYKEV